MFVCAGVCVCVYEKKREIWGGVGNELLTEKKVKEGTVVWHM